MVKIPKWHEDAAQKTPTATSFIPISVARKLLHKKLKLRSIENKHHEGKRLYNAYLEKNTLLLEYVSSLLKKFLHSFVPISSPLKIMREGTSGSLRFSKRAEFWISKVFSSFKMSQEKWKVFLPSKRLRLPMKLRFKISEREPDAGRPPGISMEQWSLTPEDGAPYIKFCAKMFSCKTWSSLWSILSK